MTALRSFRSDEEVPDGSMVWFRWCDGGSPKLGKVLGSVGCLLVIQTGPDVFEDIEVRPRWCYYDAADIGGSS